MAREKKIWCPVRVVLETIEGKWTAHIITELLSGKKRHSELAKRLGKINPKTLTDRLRDLEKAGIVQRKMYEEIPPRVEYSLTARGNELSSIFEALNELGTSWRVPLRVELSSVQLCPHCHDGNGDGRDGGGRDGDNRASRSPKQQSTKQPGKRSKK